MGVGVGVGVGMGLAIICQTVEDGCYSYYDNYIVQ